MLITKETDYALRILRTLSEGGCHTVGALAAREALPRNFAYKIVKKLERAGLIGISRGNGGGCYLACALGERNLSELPGFLPAWSPDMTASGRGRTGPAGSMRSYAGCRSR